MENETKEVNAERYAKAILYLLPFGWLPKGKIWHFEKNGKIYDLSASDITLHEMIEEKGLCLI